MLFARPAFALLSQALLAIVFRLRRRDDSWRAAAAWWTVYGSLVDVGCLIALARLARGERARLVDVMGVAHARPAKPSRAMGDVLALVPAVVLSSAVSRPFYGDGQYPPQISIVRVPAWAAAYSVTVWPALWGITEEATYLGYALPRLEALTGSTPTAATVVALCWAGQHLAMPLLPERRYLAARALTALPISAAFTGVYILRGRRLRPLIVAHWLSDALTGFIAAVRPLLTH